MTDAIDPRAGQLSRAWDAVIRGDLPGPDAPDVMGTVQALDDENQAIQVSPALQDSIWDNVLKQAVTAVEREQAPVLAAPAGSHLIVGRIVYWAQRLAWMLIAGFAGGFIAGISARMTMRLAGILTVDRNRFMLTENDARVGEMTFAGTMTLGMIGGALGMCAILLYVLIRDRLPFAGWQRSAVFAWLLLLVFGYVLMDPSNPDYQRFGPAWLNVLTFSSLYLVMGFAAAQIYEAGGRASSVEAWFLANRKRTLGRIAFSIGICGLGLLLIPIALFLGTASLLIPLIAAAFWVAGRVIRIDLVNSFHMPVLVRQWGAWVVPGILGFILTARGIAEILLNT